MSKGYTKKIYFKNQNFIPRNENKCQRANFNLNQAKFYNSAKHFVTSTSTPISSSTSPLSFSTIMPGNDFHVQQNYFPIKTSITADVIRNKDVNDNLNNDNNNNNVEFPKSERDQDVDWEMPIEQKLCVFDDNTTAGIYRQGSQFDRSSDVLHHIMSSDNLN